MGNESRYEVWKVARNERGEGYRWAIWDNENEMVILSGLAPDGDSAVEEVRTSISFLTTNAQIQEVPKQ